MPTIAQRVRQRARTPYRRWAVRWSREPSYAYKHLEMVRVRRRMRELGCKDPAFAIDGKDDAHGWARQMSLPVPELLWRGVDATRVPWTDLPERFVLKPCRAASSRGVYLLERDGDGYRELRTGDRLEPAEIERQLGELRDQGVVSPAVIAEALVDDPRAPGLPPIDYKVATFHGQVGMIEARAHRRDGVGRPTSTWRVFDEHWNDLGNAFNDPAPDASIPPPLHREELLDLARTVSLAIPRPFLRVDLYDSADGPVFGEVTPEPGGEPLPRRDVDRLLGRHWEDAEARLRVHAAQAGWLTPVHVPLPMPSDGTVTDPARGSQQAAPRP